MKLLIGAATVAMLSLPGVAQAQDDSDDWSGFYIGAEAGGASGKTTTSSTDSIGQLTNVIVPGRGVVVVPGTTTSTSASDTRWRLVYGGLIGGQFQTGGLILGLEADLHGPSGDVAATSASAPLPGTILSPSGGSVVASRTVRSSYDWSLRGRIGFTLGKRTMIYASGGIAGSRLRVTGQDTFSIPAGTAPPAPNPGPFFNAPAIGPIVRSAQSSQRSVTGWTAGGGLETKLSKTIGIGLDGRYTHYGTQDFALNQSATVSQQPLVINGSAYDTSALGAFPGTTRVKLSEFRLAARIIFHF